MPCLLKLPKKDSPGIVTFNTSEYFSDLFKKKELINFLKENKKWIFGVNLSGSYERLREFPDESWLSFIMCYSLKSPYLDNININTHDGVRCRFEDQEVKKIISTKTNAIKTFTAKAGTVVFFDASCIHSGGVLTDGGLRYALTNYYYPSYEDIASRKSVFKNAHKN